MSFSTVRWSELEPDGGIISGTAVSSANFQILSDSSDGNFKSLIITINSQGPSRVPLGDFSRHIHELTSSVYPNSLLPIS